MSICRKETKNLHTAFHLYKHRNPTTWQWSKEETNTVLIYFSNQQRFIYAFQQVTSIN